MGKRVMIVDDNPTLVRLCKLILEREGHQVLGAFSGRECLDSLDGNHVDLILLDILLNDMNGWEVLEKIRADERWENIPVIVVTCLSRWQAGDHPPSNSLAGYITKPFQVARFLDQIRRVLSNGQYEKPVEEAPAPRSTPLLQEAAV